LEEFLAKNVIHHRRTVSYHPASNGLAERAVQTFKEGMKKMSNKEGFAKLECLGFSLTDIVSRPTQPQG
jgi:hypothetical protein